MNPIVLEPFNSKYLGKLKNRVVMSAMARGFADKNHCCTQLMSDYYVRRAENGVAFILTGGMIIHPSADGYNNVAHMWNEDHSNSWKKTIEKVHQVGSKIFSQLWHCGRISHTDFTGGVQPVSSSGNQADGINRQNNKTYSVPRPLAMEEIPKIYDMYLNAAEHAMTAGFDGVELHMGHGYLVDQFFDSRINERTDMYGGSVKNRCRFALELAETFLQKYGSKKVMIRMSPSREMGSVYDWLDLECMLDYLVPALDKLGLRLLDISCARSDYYKTTDRIIRLVRPKWKYFLMGGASLSCEQACREVDNKHLDMVTWGRYVLANPDFVSRLKKNVKLEPITQELLKTLY